MRLVLIVLMSMFVGACAMTRSKESLQMKYHKADRQFDPYLSLFKAEAALRGIEINYPRKTYIVLVQNLKALEGPIGVCRAQEDTLTILIDFSYWMSHGYPYRENLFFHELGHCALGLGHDDSTNRRGVPLSLMHSSEVNAIMYSRYRDYYLDRLFKSYIESSKYKLNFLE